MAVKVVVDSSSGVGRELSDRWGVGVIPMYVTFGSTTYREGVDLLPADFYRSLRESDENPKTAAPNPADFAAAYRRYALEGFDHVVVVAPSTQLSGIAQYAQLGARDVTTGVSVVDSRQGAGAQALVAAHAARVAAVGASPAEVVAAAGSAVANCGVWMCLDTLRYLRRSGRLSAPQAVAGDLIRIKPIVSFVDGVLTVVDKPRTRARATERLLRRLDGGAVAPAHLLAMYSDNPADGQELVGRLQARYPDSGVVIDVGSISAVVGGNCGGGARGVAAVWT